MKKPKHFKRLSAKDVLFIAREAVLLALVAFFGWFLVSLVILPTLPFYRHTVQSSAICGGVFVRGGDFVCDWRV